MQNAAHGDLTMVYFLAALVFGGTASEIEYANATCATNGNPKKDSVYIARYQEARDPYCSIDENGSWGEIVGQK